MGPRRRPAGGLVDVVSRRNRALARKKFLCFPAARANLRARRSRVRYAGSRLDQEVTAVAKAKSRKAKKSKSTKKKTMKAKARPKAKAKKAKKAKAKK